MNTLPLKLLLRNCLFIYIICQVFFLIYIQFPRTHNFDEFHYMPSAKQFLALKENQNWEHPPLAKMIMATGIGIFGDRPFGWRVMSTVFGALTMVGMYLWGLALFRKNDLAVLTLLFSLTNNITYVQSRIGMLDPFMMGFLVFGLAFFTEIYQRSRLSASEGISFSQKTLTRLLLSSGVCFALATACKWFGVVGWALCGGIAMLMALLRYWKVEFKKRAVETDTGEWHEPKTFSEVHPRAWINWFVAVPLLFYFATFIPYYFLDYKTPDKIPGLFGVFKMQAQMFDGQLRVVNSHPYMSDWRGWPILARPIWFAFDKEGAAKEFVRGVIMIGNPALMWGGLIALVGVLIHFIRSRSANSFLVLTFYLGLYLSWAFIPRKVAFFYYYYPAALALSLAMTQVISLGRIYAPRYSKAIQWTLLGSVVFMFAYFFPILAAIKIPSDSFTRWMWFRSWI